MMSYTRLSMEGFLDSRQWSGLIGCVCLLLSFIKHDCAKASLRSQLSSDETRSLGR